MNIGVSLRALDVGLILNVPAEGMPEIIHWGKDPGPLGGEEFNTLSRTMISPLVINTPDVPMRLALIPEARFGWFGKPGLIGSHQGRNWTPAWRTAEVRVDGIPVDGFCESGPGSVEVDVEADELKMTITIRMLEQGLVMASARLTNHGQETYWLDELTLALPVPATATEILDFAGRWGVERAPQRTTLNQGQYRREGRRGRTGADSSFILHLGTPGFNYGAGEVWAVHTAWSGNHIHYAEKDSMGAQLIGGGELLLPGEGRLEQGQSYRTPWLYASYGNGLDQVAHRFHDFLRARADHPGADRPVTLNVWEAVYFDHDAKRLNDLAKRAADLGVERFVLDDGWFGSRRNDYSGLGDWVVSAEVWPTGLHPLIDQVHELGMQFGLWFEPEMVNIDSDLARAHPQWVMRPAGRLPIESRHQQVLNLGIEGAYQHVLGQMLAIFDEYQIDYVKWDHNRDLIDAGTFPAGQPGVHDQTLAFYRLLDELQAAHPEIEFESCSSGGARIDLEVVQRAKRVWVSDCIDPEERQRMLWWTSQLLPSELMGSHIASGRSHTTARWHDLNFRAATAVFGHLGIEWDLAQASDEELLELSTWIKWYKRNRGVLHSGRMIRVDCGFPDVYLKGVITRDKAIFSLSMLKVTAQAGLGMIRFPGLDPAATYRVSVLDHQQIPAYNRTPWQIGEPVELSGALLATVGLRAPQLLPATAVLFEFERI